MMLLMYRIATVIIAPYLLLRFAIRAFRNRSYLSRAQERIGFGYRAVKSQGVWIHAVSVGEVNATVPLVKGLLEIEPDVPVVISTMTTTGADRVNRLFGSSVTHCYLPYDYRFAMNRFLRHVQPKLGMVMETEIWPNMIACCEHNNIPLVYTNVRLSDKSWRGYMRFRGLFRLVLRKIQHFAVQGQADARRLALLGAPKERIAITGSLKFDMDVPASVSEAGESIRRALGWNRPVVVFASSHEGEEVSVLQMFSKLRELFPELLLVIVPRHPERFSQVIRLCQKTGFDVGVRSEMETTVSDHVDIFVVDTMGELTTFIAASDITVMGGSFVKVGGHNLLEAASLQRPVVFGPHMFNFAEISEMFVQQGAGIQVDSFSELESVLSRLLLDAATRDQLGLQGEKIISQNKGALTKVLKVAKVYL